MERILFLGTSGSVASAERDNSSFLVISGRTRVLIDCPGCVAQKLQRSGMDFRRLSTVCFTHAHADHTYGFPSLLQSQYLLDNRINVFGSGETLALLKKLQALYGLTARDKYPLVEYHRTSAGDDFYRSAGLTVRAFSVRHLPGSLGYTFTFGGSGLSVAFSGDTAESEQVVAAAREADILVHDCFCPERIFRQYPRLYKKHASGLQLGKIARRAGVKTLVPVHFASEVKYSFRELRSEIRRNFKGRLIFPRDGEFLDLGKGKRVKAGNQTLRV